MSIWPDQPAYHGCDGDIAKFAVLNGFIAISAYDCIAKESAVIAMTADQAAAFARALLDTAMSLQEELANE